MHGCMEIIKDKLEDDVVPMMVSYAGLGVVLAIIELICVVLACAYVAQIRRSKPTNDNVFLSTWWKKTNKLIFYTLYYISDLDYQR